MEKLNKNKKVVVAMSGGVDSSVAAVLLKKQVYDVIGVFMKFWTQRYGKAECGASQNRCCSSDAEKRARKVAEILGIPFYVFNFEKEFKKRVVDYFLREEKAGRTPNPCVVCNKEIKLGLFLEKALKLGGDYIATGHYARKRDVPSSPPKARLANGGKFPAEGEARQWRQVPSYELYKGKDKKKDQSYFLWKLSQKQLGRVLFPVGNHTKIQVRKLAKKFKLPTAETPESQEICFVQTTINAFLAKYIKPSPGDIVNINNKIIGGHEGLCFYTIGQRKGIKLARGPSFVRPRRTTAGKPYYVLDKNLKRNVLIVTQNERDLYKKELIIRNINWVSGKQPRFPVKASVKIRYRHEPASAIVKGNRVIFDKAQRAITPGQSVVFYKDQQLLGGGIIGQAAVKFASA